MPHSEAYYGATVCHQNDGACGCPARSRTCSGHPDNPLGAGQLPIDAVDALAAAQPELPVGRLRRRGRQGDADGDGNFIEPDGVIDHVVLVHAGEDKSGGGGAEGTYAIWAHSSHRRRRRTDARHRTCKLSNYIVQPEDSGVGVFAHEYGHDLGLPDLYDTVRRRRLRRRLLGPDVAPARTSGPIFQSMPTHMGIWDKCVLGWADPWSSTPVTTRATVNVGQTSRTAQGHRGRRQDQPAATRWSPSPTPHSGAQHVVLQRRPVVGRRPADPHVDVPAGATDAKFWMWNNYVIEEDWDFGFVEVSTDGGATWTEQKVFNEAGAEVSTPDGYADPNGRA